MASEPQEKDLIEGGDIADIGDLPFESRRHREKTAKLMALILVCILGGSGLLHYVTVAVLVYHGKTDVADKLGTFFNAWLPVVSGLVGSATTYYFTKERS